MEQQESDDNFLCFGQESTPGMEERGKEEERVRKEGVAWRGERREEKRRRVNEMYRKEQL